MTHLDTETRHKINQFSKNPGTASMIRSGSTPGTIVRCGLTDPIASDLAVSVVFFYDRAIDETRLADGLARALDRLPVFAGRLRMRNDALEIVCTDDGVPFTTVSIDKTLDQVISTATLVESGLVDHVDAESAHSGHSPLMKVQVTRLVDGGMALGCSWHHLVGDMHTFMLLMRSWSAFVEGTTPPDVTIVEDRDAYLDTALPPDDNGQPSYRLMNPDEAVETGAALYRAMQTSRVVQLYFSDAEVDRMRSQFGAAAQRSLSANDVLCAHILDTLCVLEDDKAVRFLDFPVNIRSRLDLPPSIVGNLLTVVDLPRAPKTPPETLASDIRAAVDGFVETHLNLRADRAFVESQDRSRFNQLMFRGMDPAHRAVILSNWSGYDVYEITFEGHRPVFFGPTPTPTSFHLPWIGVLFKGFNNAGYLCTLAVPADLAELLRHPGDTMLHRFRTPEDQLPKLATSISTLI